MHKSFYVWVSERKVALPLPWAWPIFQEDDQHSYFPVIIVALLLLSSKLRQNFPKIDKLSEKKKKFFYRAISLRSIALRERMKQITSILSWCQITWQEQWNQHLALKLSKLNLQRSTRHAWPLKSHWWVDCIILMCLRKVSILQS